ncbi:hypothetical protein C0033_09010 [Clostridium sp. chh4-2]|uniref:hypothetical protein n=1 Tax=Clostridium sp. chh4-2 TaxID=2067550 RepID=UPI000CCDE892|nr:hypothetical protein [Clostridium sp. chh4-2]PNV62242.1 hypothetical protein C0033_09010 [Clostridium sp. chh4-2]
MDKVRVTELRPGQTIRFESGTPDNWVKLKIHEVHHFEKMVMLVGDSTGWQNDYSFRQDEMVEVVADE